MSSSYEWDATACGAEVMTLLLLLLAQLPS
jgi:hypothetical protein